MNIRSLTLVVAALLIAHEARAQRGTLVPIANTSYIGINPLGIPFDIFTAEGETGVAQGITLGALGSHIDVDNDRYSSLDFKFRYYPGEVVLRGFSLGATVGVLGYSKRSEVFFPNGAGSSTERESLNAATLGIIADYNWLLGSQHRFLVGTGLGAKRVLASSDERSRVGLDRAYMTARFTVGIAF